MTNADAIFGDYTLGQLKKGESLAKSLERAAKAVSLQTGLPHSWIWIDSHKLAERVFQWRAKIEGVAQLVVSPIGSGPIKIIKLNNDGSQSSTHVPVITTFSSGQFTFKTPGADPDQTRDYVQHCLREMHHGCRYAVGHLYQIHHDSECSPACRERRDRKQAQVAPSVANRAYCPTCYLMLTTAGLCSAGCEEI